MSWDSYPKRCRAKGKRGLASLGVRYPFTYIDVERSIDGRPHVTVRNWLLMHSLKLNMKSNKLQRVSVSDEEKLPFFKFTSLYLHVPWYISTFNYIPENQGSFFSIVPILTRKPTVKSQRQNPRRKRIKCAQPSTHTHTNNRGRPRFETWDLEDVPEVGVLGKDDDQRWRGILLYKAWFIWHIFFGGWGVGCWGVKVSCLIVELLGRCNN